ncbi:MAG: PD-(D/E)XK nuclease family protein [Nanoarchaeota archaeon]
MLNLEQKESLKELSKPLIIQGDVQTGKTKTIIEKIFYLVDKNKYNLNEILTLSFNYKNVQTISKELESKNINYISNTFEDFCLQIIKENIKYISLLDKNYRIINKNFVLLYLFENIEHFNLSSIQIKNNIVNLSYELQSIIRSFKKLGYDLKSFEKLITEFSNINVRSDNENEKNNSKNKIYENDINFLKKYDIINSSIGNISCLMDIFIVYSKYELYKKQHNFLDKEDIYLYTRELLKSNEKIRKEISDKYKYILIDEFENITRTQLEIVNLISKDNNLTITYNPNQEINKFKENKYSSFNYFKKLYPSNKIICLNENYKHSKKILENIDKVSNNILTNKKINIDSVIKDKGEFNLIEAVTQKAQNKYIIDRIKYIKGKNINAKIAILVRDKLEIKDYIKLLQKNNINSNNKKVDLFQKNIIKLILDQCKIINSPYETDLLIFKLFKDYGIKERTMQSILRIAYFKKKSLYYVLQHEDFSNFEDENDLIELLTNKITYLVSLKCSKLSLYDFILNIIYNFNTYQQIIDISNKSNYYNIDKKNQIKIINSFLEFVLKYVEIYKNNDISKFIKLCECARSLNLFLDINIDKSELTTVNVEVLTIKESLNKYFDYVVIPSLNQNKFPKTFIRDKIELFNQFREKFIENEKKLFYIGISRPLYGLDLIYLKFNQGSELVLIPSEFLKFLNIKKQVYCDESKEVNFLIEDKIKNQIISNIKTFLFENQFDIAKQEIKLLEDLYDKKNLKQYFNNSTHPKYDYYKDMINNNNNDNDDGSKSCDNKKDNKSLILQDDIEFDHKNQVYSVSQLQTYISCPKKYMYQYIYKLPGIAKHYFDFGTSMHYVVEQIVNDVSKYSKEILFSKAISLLSKNWISKGYINYKQEKEYFNLGIKSLKKFIEKEIEIQKSGTKIFKTEYKFLINLNGKKIMGFIDRIDKNNDKFEIIDYKTSNSVLNENHLQSNLQLYIYYLAVKDTYAIEPANLGLWYLIHDKIIKINPKKFNVKELNKLIKDTIFKIEQHNFIATPSNFSCNFCDYKEICKNSCLK